MERETDQQPWFMSLGFYGGFFLFFLLLSLDNLWSSWGSAAGQGWFLKFAILVPWVFCALIGTSLYQGIRRGNINVKMGGPLLMNLGFVVMFAYEAMYKLGRIGH